MPVWAYPCLLAITLERTLILMSPPAPWQSSARGLGMSVVCILSNDLVCVKEELEYPRVVGEGEEVGAVVEVVCGETLLV